MTPKQQRALLALLASPTREKAAAAAGITSKTLRGYLDNPEFQDEYRKTFAGLVTPNGYATWSGAVCAVRPLAIRSLNFCID